MSLNALAGYDGDIGVISEERLRPFKVSRREAPAEFVDGCENAFGTGTTNHQSTIAQPVGYASGHVPSR
jgi:hypothetical protein